MWEAANTCAPHPGWARSKRQSTIAQSGSPRCSLSSAGSISVVGMDAFSASWGCRYNREHYLGRGDDGNRGFLGQRQSVRMAGTAGARIQTPAVREPPAAVLQAGAQVPGDALAQPARARPGAEG